jgi:hypothetical protein
MPNRIAMGVATWWDPLVAVLLTLTGIAGLVVLGGRVYTGAILHTGSTLGLRDAWRGPSAPRRSLPEATAGSTGVVRPQTDAATAAPTPGTTIDRSRYGVLIALGGFAVALGAAVFVLTHDFVIGLAAGALFYAAACRVVGARAHAHR